MGRRRVTCGVCGLLLGLVLAAAAAAEQPRGLGANRSEATRDALVQVGALSLPPGTSGLDSSSAPAALRSYPFDCRADAFGSFHDYLSVSREIRYWQTPDDPAHVVSWVRAHVPEGSQLTSSGEATTSSGVVVWHLTFSFGSDPGRVKQRCLQVTVTPMANGGRSAVGAQGQATWVLARPTWDYVPRQVSTIAATHVVSGRSIRTSFTDPGRVRWIAAQINRAEVVQPQPFHCFRGHPESFELVFAAERSGAVLAQSSISFRTGCVGLALSVDGRPGPALFLPRHLLHALETIPALQPGQVRRHTRSS